MRIQQTSFRHRLRATAKAAALLGSLAVAAAGARTALADEYAAKQTCGGLVGKACPAGMFCENAPGMCQGADIQGTCVGVPRICPKIFLPVCGCNGKTYGNDCERQAAQVSKDHDGPCK